MLTGADKTNREYVGEDVSFADGLDPNLVKLFYDPQTAGGLLLGDFGRQGGRIVE